MKIALLSYPMLFQREGGLQIQIRRTASELEALGVTARIFEPTKEKLEDYDIVHVFSAMNGTYRIIEHAKSIGRKAIISPVLQPMPPRFEKQRAKLGAFLSLALTSYRYNTLYNQIFSALDLSDRIIALSETEAQTAVKLYDQSPAKISIIPNGVSEGFFQADASLFMQEHPVASPFVLMVGTISDYKNQLTVIRATESEGYPIVMIGQADASDYLDRCLETGGERVTYCGTLANDDPLLASAYAAASVLAIPSRGESAPLSALESLAAGTPVVITNNHGLGLRPKEPLFSAVEPYDTAEILAKIKQAINTETKPDTCRDLVRRYSWSHVAAELKAVYQELLQ